MKMLVERRLGNKKTFFLSKNVIISREKNFTISKVVLWKAIFLAQSKKLC
jgi:hypothetical protein